MDIDLLYAEVMQKLILENKIARVSQKLISSTKNDDRVQQVYDVLKGSKMFPKPMIVQKCAVKSTVYRNLGNKNFQNHNDYEAWQYYNLALLHAPVDSVDYIFALANRSAVFFDLKKYEECLNDIEQVSNMGYPERLKDKLLKRESSCKEALSKPLLIDEKNTDAIETMYSMKGSRNPSYSNSIEIYEIGTLALRTVIKARCEQPDWQSLFNIISEVEANLNTEYRGCTRVDDKWVYDSQSYATIHALVSNIEKRSVSDIFRKGVTAAVFLHILMKETEFLKDAKTGIVKRVGGLLLHHIMTVPTNMHGISVNTPTSEGKYVNDMSLGSAAYAFFSLLNHSCSPNVTRFSRFGTGNMKLIAIRPIKKGMQLFDNYGVHHATQDRESRQSTLNFQYKFVCTCEACVDNWPTYHNLGAAKNLPKLIAEKKKKILSPNAIEKLERGCKDIAMALYKPLCELITVLDNYAPCVELADCQESLKQCLGIYEGFLPFGFTKVIDWDVS
ncbi:SET and MYND domain-containing protein 4 [Eumeta japonica]|uniref:SET and MYND domain-containing protein 4 n=1 Tax=Eumeta variegata TaxID=151549 RepID=A0A4C1V7A7_EUMVA|nr:SET and MYND domain-containing protein 4 [Eumeta japonica]